MREAVEISADKIQTLAEFWPLVAFLFEGPAEDPAAFQKTIAKEPNRFRAVAGASRAASQAGDETAALKYATQLLVICEQADTPGRPELQAARALAGGR